MSSRPAVILRGVSFAFGDAAPVLGSVDLSIRPGWHALVGANGSGKTTLLRLIAGELSPDEGTIERPPGARVIACAQSVEAPVSPELAERDDREAIRLRASLELDPAELGRWATLSPGERRRWQIGAALASDPEVLLLDEPTNHLDREGRALLVRALRAFRGVGLVVSHDRALLDAITTSTIRIDAGRARAWAGAYSDARGAWEDEARARSDERARRKDVVRSAERALAASRRAQEDADRSRSASHRMRSRHDSDARSAGATTLALWAEAGAGRAVGRRHAELARAQTSLASLEPIERSRGRALFVDFEPASRRVVLSIDAPELRAGDRTILREVRLTLGRRDRARLVGANGAGKTTLIHALLGSTRDPRVLFVPQEIDPRATSRAIAALRALAPAEKGRALSLIAALGADPARILATGSASPGEARQFAIAAGLAARAHTVVLDEPTNHLDLPAIERLEDALARFPGALLVVTHDERLAERLFSEETTALEAAPERACVEWRIEGGLVRQAPRA